MSYSVIVNGVNLRSSSYGIYRREMEEPILPAPVLDFQSVPYSYGGQAQGGFYGPRSLTIPCFMVGESNADLYTKLDNLRALLDAETNQTIEIEGIPDRYWSGRADSEITGTRINERVMEFDLSFLCADPRAYAKTQRTTPDFAITADPMALTVETAVVAGTAYTDPVWTIKNSAVATATNIELANTTTTETMHWVGSLGTSCYLRIDSDSWQVTKSTDGGSNFTAANSGIQATSLFPRLKPRVQNSISVTGVSTGTVSLTYRARYK